MKQNQTWKLSYVVNEAIPYLEEFSRLIIAKEYAQVESEKERLTDCIINSKSESKKEKSRNEIPKIIQKCIRVELEQLHIAQICMCLGRIYRYIIDNKLDDPILLSTEESEDILNENVADEPSSVSAALTNVVCAKRKDNGKWVNGYYFCLHHNDERTHIHHFVIPYDTPIPKDKPIGEIQVEIDPNSIIKNKITIAATRQFDFNVRIMGKDQCLEIAKIAVLDDPKAESDDLLRYLPDHVFGNTFEALAVNADCVIVKDKKNNQWSVPFYFIESSMNR